MLLVALLVPVDPRAKTGTVQRARVHEDQNQGECFFHYERLEGDGSIITQIRSPDDEDSGIGLRQTQDCGV